MRASEQSSRLRAELDPVTLDGVRAKLPPDAALVELAIYRPFDPKALTYGKPCYVAYTLVADGTVRYASLGDVERIDAAGTAFRDTLRAGKGGALADVDAEVKPKARALDALVFAPVRALLGSTTRLLIAPEGGLSLIPFDALVDEQGRYATEVYEISYLTSGRDLLRLGSHVASRQPSVVIANPEFGGAAGSAESRILVMTEADAKQQSSVRATDILAHAYFPPLPGTAAEADALRAMLPQARVLTGGAATKSALTALAGPELLHLATHGFFLAGVSPKAAPARGLELDSSTSATGVPAPPDEEDPLLRSGLALAGANLHHGGDGILTALEAAGLDLWGTKLVVLSACETGLGEVHNGDGVYGLRRALVLAGSETQVMSLWPISDLGTRDLMLGYYTHLAAGEGRSEAMRHIRLELVKNPARRHPYFWASFIVSGEWASLDERRVTVQRLMGTRRSDGGSDATLATLSPTCSHPALSCVR